MLVGHPAAVLGHDSYRLFDVPFFASYCAITHTLSIVVLSKWSSYAVMKARWTTLQEVKTSYAGKITRTIDGNKNPSVTDNKITFYDQLGAAATYPSDNKWCVLSSRHSSRIISTCTRT